MHDRAQQINPVIGVTGEPSAIKRLAPLYAKLHERGWNIQVLPTAHIAQSLARTPSGSAEKLVALLVNIEGTPSAAVQAEYRAALAQGVLVVPILSRRGVTLPDDLRQTQWIDATRSLQAAWSDLLLVLDLAQMAWHPAITTQPPLDVDIMVARATRGLVPPDWDVYHTNQRMTEIFPLIGIIFVATMLTLFLAMLGLTMPFMPAGTFAISSVTLAVLFGLFLLPAIVGSVRNYMLHRPTRDFIVLTPDGFIHALGERRTVCPFALIKSIQVADARTNLTMMNRDGSMQSLLPGSYYDKAHISLLIRRIMDAFASYQRRHLHPNLPLPNERTSAPAIFISYARRNSSRADQLDEHLRANGFNTWIDRRLLIGGQRWDDELHRAIAASAALVLIVSPAAMRSAAVREEYEYALSLGKPIVAITAQRTAGVPQRLQSMICGAFARTRYRTYRTCYFPLAKRLADEGITLSQQAGETRFEPDLAWGMTLSSAQMPATWHLWRNKLAPQLGFFSSCYGVTIISVVAVFVILHWWPTNIFLMLAAGIIGCSCFLLASIPLWLELREPHLLLVTPLGFVGLGIQMIAWDFDDIIEIQRDVKRPSYLKLTLASTGAKMEYQVEESPSEAIIAAILAAFLSYKKQVEAEHALISPQPTNQ